MTQPYQELREAVERATSGPWTVGPYQYVLSPSGGEVANVSDGQKYADWGDDAEAQAEANAAFIALARNNILSLIEDNERMREALTPFAEFNTKIDAHPDAAKTPDDYCIHDGLKVGDFRRAFSVIKDKP